MDLNNKTAIVIFQKKNRFDKLDRWIDNWVHNTS